MEQLGAALQMMGLAMLSVGLWTLRVALTARGRKIGGSITAALEAMVFLLAFSKMLGDMKAIERVAGYAVGVGLGTLLGVYLDERLSSGQSEVRIVTQGRDMGLIDDLHAQGWPVTWTHGHGPAGDVTIAFVAVDDARLNDLLKRLRHDAPDEFWTVERLRSARASRHHDGWVQVGGVHGFRIGSPPGLHRAPGPRSRVAVSTASRNRLRQTQP